MDPHEKVSMDAEKIMSGSWDFEFMVKKTLKKTCSNDEAPYATPCLFNTNNERINMILYQNNFKIYDIFHTLGLTSKCPS